MTPKKVIQVLLAPGLGRRPALQEPTEVRRTRRGRMALCRAGFEPTGSPSSHWAPHQLNEDTVCCGRRQGLRWGVNQWGERSSSALGPPACPMPPQALFLASGAPRRAYGGGNGMGPPPFLEPWCAHSLSVGFWLVDPAHPASRDGEVPASACRGPGGGKRPLSLCMTQLQGVLSSPSSHAVSSAFGRLG